MVSMQSKISLRAQECMLGKDPLCAYSAMQRVAHEDGNCELIYAVPLTPDANAIEHKWGTNKGDVARAYGPQMYPVIMGRLRNSNADRCMVKHGAIRG